MRQPLFVLGLAFVTTVLIANVEARKCYAEGYQWGRKLNGVETVDCDELARELEDKANAPRGTIPRITECATADVTNERGEKWIQSGCITSECDGDSSEWPSYMRYWVVRCTTRCNTDYCNGGSTGGNVPPRGRNVPPPRGPNVPPRGSAPVGGAIASTPHIPLLIAVVGSAIAVLGM